MAIVCSSCGKSVSASAGKYVYYQGKIMFTCKSCAKTMNDEIKCARLVCSTIDRKKSRAEYIINHTDAFETFLNSSDNVLNRVPDASNLLSDIPLLVSLLKSYIATEYTDILPSTIVAVMAALLYVVSPIDMIPDLIPGVGFKDDAMVVSFCIKQFHEDIEKYRIWYEKSRRESVGEIDICSNNVPSTERL